MGQLATNTEPLNEDENSDSQSTRRLKSVSEQPTQLHIDNITLKFPTKDGGQFTAIENLSLEVKNEEFVVIVGPSGCGKSSLLYLTAGLNNPTDGEIRVAGDTVKGPSAERGMVFQSYTLFPWLTVAQNIEFGLKQKKMAASECKKIVDDYIKQVGLENFANHFPKQLSGGMKQRVAIAR